MKDNKINVKKKREKIFAIYIIDMELISRIYTELIQIIRRQQVNQKKVGQTQKYKSQ